MSYLLKALRVLTLSAPLVVSASVPLIQGCGGDDCCKHCDTGKACGDTCIASNATCTIVGGCACN